jgi:hypothetical protein
MAFDKSQIKDLDEIVVSALELFSKERPPRLEIPEFRRPLILGSVNAAAAGRIIFEDKNAVFADESNYRQKLDSIGGIDGAVLISASGGKDAPAMAKELKKRKIPTVLLTCNPDAPARKYADKVQVFPRQPEPYTYNVSTYLGMILSRTGEDPKKILEHIKRMKIPQDLGNYDAFFILIPHEFELAREMFLTKFDELFGPLVSERVFTLEQTKHAKTVVESEKEMFISFGYKNKLFGTRRLGIPLPKKAGYGAMIATVYYMIGHIQKRHPPYFRDNIEAYCKKASKFFGQEIRPMVG